MADVGSCKQDRPRSASRASPQRRIRCSVVLGARRTQRAPGGATPRAPAAEPVPHCKEKDVPKHLQATPSAPAVRLPSGRSRWSDISPGPPVQLGATRRFPERRFRTCSPISRGCRAGCLEVLVAAPPCSRMSGDFGKPARRPEFSWPVGRVSQDDFGRTSRSQMVRRLSVAGSSRRWVPALREALTGLQGSVYLVSGNRCAHSQRCRRP